MRAGLREGMRGWRPVSGSAGSAAGSGRMSGNHSRQASGGTAVTVSFSVSVRQVLEDGSEAPLEGELAAALAAPTEQLAGLAPGAEMRARSRVTGTGER